MPRPTFQNIGKVLAFLADAISIIYILVNMGEMSICNPVVSILFYSIIGTILFFLLPFLWDKISTKAEKTMFVIITLFTLFAIIFGWNKIKANSNCMVPKKEKMATSKIDTNGKKLDTPKSVSKTDEPKLPHRAFVKVTQPAKTLPIVQTKVDTPKKESTAAPQFDLKGATIQQSAIGINPTVNNYNGVQQRHLTEKDLTFILSNLENKEQGIKFYLINPDSESQNLQREIQTNLAKYGYNKFYPGSTSDNNNEVYNTVAVEKISYGIRITIYPSSNVR